MKRFKKMEEFRRDQFKAVLRAVLRYYNKRHEEIITPERTLHVLEPRQVLAYLCYTLIDGITQGEIVYWMGCNERSTITKGIKTLRGYYEVDKTFIDKINKIKSNIEYGKEEKRPRWQAQRLRSEIKVRRGNYDQRLSSSRIKKRSSKKNH